MDTTFARKIATLPTGPDRLEILMRRRKALASSAPSGQAQIEARIAAALRTRAPYGDGDGIA